MFPEELSSEQDSDLAWLDGVMQYRPTRSSTVGISHTSPGFLCLKIVSRISMERAWWQCHRLRCCWWDREHLSPTSESPPKPPTYPTRPTWTNPAGQEWGMAKGMPGGHCWTSHHLWTDRFLCVFSCSRLQRLLCSWHIPFFISSLF